MDEFELKYCENVNRILSKKLNDIRKKINELSQRFAEMRKDLDMNYSDYVRGGDMAERRSSMENIEELENNYEQEKKRLNLQIKTPYFARIDFTLQGKENPQKIYIGIGSITHNKKLYVADWRAPISSMYYDASIGDASFNIGENKYYGKVTLKRQYKIENGKLISYFDTDLTINDEILQEILSQNVSVKMKQIVTSIQKEQNAIVRSDINENMLVQGIAGSGKTSIALHRAAYLLYKHRKDIKSSDVIILSPNNVFSSYISEVLPQLGENNLVETTFAQIARAELKRPIESRENLLDEIATRPSQDQLNEISYKSSYEYLDSLLRFLKGPFTETFTPQTLSFCIKDNEDEEKEYITFPEEQTKELFFKTFKGYDIYERINKIAWQYAMVFTEQRHYNKEQNAGLKDRFKKLLYNFLPIKDVDKVYQIFMAREELVSHRGNNIKYMDKGTILAIKHYMYGFEHDYSAKYLIVDEMQDFTPVDIYLFKKLWTCPCIVVGDVNQCIEKNLSDEYLKITADFLGCKLLDLKKTYRSTREIAQFTNELIGQSDNEYVNRSGEKPTLFMTNNQANKIEEIIKTKCQSYDHIAIICKCNKEAEGVYKSLSKKIDCTLMQMPDDYNNRILVTTCATAKGIEFDAVIIPNATEENYKNAIDKNVLYVSSTRALHMLAFVSEKTPTPFLKNKFPPIKKSIGNIKSSFYVRLLSLFVC